MPSAPSSTPSSCTPSATSSSAISASPNGKSRGGRNARTGDRVNVIKQVKCADRWRMVRVAEKNGKILRDQVIIKGQTEHHPEGRYFLEWYEGGKCRRQAVPNFDDLAALARRKKLELQAQRAGILAKPITPEVVAAPQQTLMSKVVEKYLEFIERHRSKSTYRGYRYTLNELFLPAYPKLYLEEVCREDILGFITHCYEKELSGRTVYDKLVVVLQMLKRHGFTKLLFPSDWPKYVETIRPIYEPQEITVMLQHATEDEARFLKFLLTSGFRDKEARFLTWRDVDFRHSAVRVTAKQIWNFKPKNYEERQVPLPTAMMELLDGAKKSREANFADIVFPNTVGHPDSENDMIVKRVAYRAKLNCGQCITRHGNKCAEGPHCSHFFLHKFRHTYATEHLRYGIDIRTLQTWLGHRDIQSTMVYLKGVQSKDAIAKINAGALAAYV